MVDISVSRLQIFADELHNIAFTLGQELLSLRVAGLKETKKSDNSIVTNADFYSDKILRQHISAMERQIPIVTEETYDADPASAPKGMPLYWCIDPIDATSNFVKGGSYFAINIALISAGKPILGFIHFPALHISYGGIAGHNAWRQNASGRLEIIQAKPYPEKNLRVIVSSHGHAKPERLGAIAPHENIGTVERIDGPIKFAHIAEGRADLYPRFTHLREWDLAAGHAIVMAAGGNIRDTSENEILYGKNADFTCPHFVARGKTV
ncbi:MAG: 3'(2'),5'-bisphosphate nucleotidase CysQ [Alphaproteobacteria bacterium]|nr:MAG: 3'(2'),5'-bisphosphate nucleotidase CysQ [Alphaproteobacteria bacterium]